MFWQYILHVYIFFSWFIASALVQAKKYENKVVIIYMIALQKSSLVFVELRFKKTDFVKGGLQEAWNCRRHCGQRSGGCQGSGGCQKPMTTCSWNDWFNFLSLFDSSFFFLFSFSLPLSFLFSSLFGGEGLQPPQPPPLPKPLSQHVVSHQIRYS